MKPAYILVNLAKNAVAPGLLRLIPMRGCLGMDGHLPKVLETLNEFAEGIGQLDVTPQGKTMLELGPGRTPHVAVAMYLAGAKGVVGLDTTLQLPKTWREAESYHGLAEALATGSTTLAARLGPELPRRQIETAVEEWPVKFLTYDGVSMPLETASVDLIVSKAVLQHVRRHHVEELVREMQRVIRPGGGMVHLIDLRDHMWINRDDVTGDWLNALRYPEWLFNAMFWNRSTYINRLRSIEWRELFQKCGFEVVAWQPRRYPECASLRQRALREPWRGFDADELRIGQVHAVLRKQS